MKSGEKYNPFHFNRENALEEISEEVSSVDLKQRTSEWR